MKNFCVRVFAVLTLAAALAAAIGASLMASQL